MAANKTFNFMNDIDFGEKLKSEDEVSIKIETPQKDISKHPVADLKKETPPSKSQNENIIVNKKYIFEPEKKSNKVVHKNFLITEEQNKKLGAFAKKLKVSENKLFGMILDNVFSDIDI